MLRSSPSMMQPQITTENSHPRGKNSVSRFVALRRAAPPYSASQTDKSPCACWKNRDDRPLFTCWGSLIVVKRNSCLEWPWYLSSSPSYCWAMMRPTLRRGAPSTVVVEVERIVASIPSSNAWPRFRETVGSVPRTNSRIPIGVVGRGAARGEVGIGVLA
jgi:hypothetical protein